MVAGGNIKLKIGADSSQAVAALQKVVAAQEKSIGKLKEQVKESRKSGKATGDMTKQGIAGFRNMAMAITGVGGAVGGVTLLVAQLSREYTALLEKQRRGAMTQLTVEEARRRAMWNVPVDMPAGQVETLVEQAARRFKVPRADVWAGMGAALSAKMSLTWKAFVSVFTETARMRGVLGAEGLPMREAAGGFLDIARAAGLKIGREVIGFTRVVGTQMRAIGLMEQLRALSRVLGQARMTGWTFRNAATLLGTMTAGMTDPEARKTTTAVLSFMGRLKAGGITVPGAGGQWLPFVPKGKGMGALAELQDRFAAMTPGQRLEFERRFPGEILARPPLMALIGRQPEAIKGFAAARERIPAPGSAAIQASLDKFDRDVARGRGAGLKRLELSFDEIIERTRLAQPAAAGGLARDKLRTLLKDLPISDIAARLERLRFEGRTDIGRRDVIDATIETIRGLQEKYRFGEKTRLRRDLGGRMGVVLPGREREPSPTYAPRVAEALEAFVAELQAERERTAPGDAQDRHTEALEKHTEALNRLTSFVGPGESTEGDIE